MLAEIARFHQALAHFREAYRLDPGNPATLENLNAVSRARAGR